jgi:DNA-binding CsgD family transcriptional regulator
MAEMAAIAASSAPLAERAQAVVETLHRWAPVFDASWVAVAVPGTSRITYVASTGLDRSVVDHLDRPSVAGEIELVGLDRSAAPVSAADFPLALEELPSWAESLLPAGLKGGVGTALFDTGGRYVGFLGLLSTAGDPPPAWLRDRLGRLSSLIARALSPMRSLVASARIVRGATAGAVLLDDGTVGPLPGLAGDALLAGDSPVVRIARATLRDGQVYRSFLWPAHDGPATAEHVRLTVLAAADLPAFVLGLVVVAPAAEHRGLTPRELQVLGLVIDGRSNQQIARRLGVSGRTVATHVEHILHKLQAPSRTLAAVRAEREGCYVPAAP